MTFPKKVTDLVFSYILFSSYMDDFFGGGGAVVTPRSILALISKSKLLVNPPRILFVLDFACGPPRVD